MAAREGVGGGGAEGGKLIASVAEAQRFTAPKLRGQEKETKEEGIGYAQPAMQS